MNLSEMLSFADIGLLGTIARHYQCDCSNHSKNELIQAILSALNRRDTIEQQLEQLTDADIRLMNRLLFDRRTYFSLEELTAIVKQTSREHSTASITGQSITTPPINGHSKTDQYDGAGASRKETVHPDATITHENRTNTVKMPKKTASSRSRHKNHANNAAPVDHTAISIAYNEQHIHTDEASPRETILKFRNRGWLFNGHSQQTKYLFRIPEDIKRRFSDCFAAHIRKQLEYIDTPAVYRDETHIIEQDILQFLRFVHQNKIPLTIDGTMYKRTLQQILALFHVQEEPVKSRGWRFGYGRKFKDYPDRFSFIYDYCYYSGLIEEQPQGLRLTSRGIERVRDQKREDLLDLYKLWLKLYKGPIPNLQPLVQWIHLICDRWTTVESLHRTLRRMIQSYYYDSTDQILNKRIIQMMMHLGLLQVGEDESRGSVVRVTKLGSRVITGTYVPEEEWIKLDDVVPLTWHDQY